MSLRGRWVDPIAGVDMVAKRNIHAPSCNQTLVKPVAITIVTKPSR